MLTIPGYIPIEKIDENPHSLLYRGTSAATGERVFIRALKLRVTAPSELTRFHRECARIRDMQHPGIVAIRDVVQIHDILALVREDWPGVPLKRIIDSDDGPFPLAEFLDIALKIADIIGNLHEHNLFHRNITPQSILFDRETRAVKLTDFGFEALVTREMDELYHPYTIENTLPYISPEQTGRMNRPVDYRTDYYSLGTVFYEMLTGGVPFPSADPVEIIHAHIARQPAPPCNIRSDIPLVVSDIVLRLMSKNAEDRYQNAMGLIADILACLERLESTGTIPHFPVGQKDASIRFHIPQRIVGREEESAVLDAAFARTREGARSIVTVTGSPGIGKSSLVHEMQRKVVTQGGYFTAGDCGQMTRDIPYGPIIDAFRRFTRQILSESEEIVDRWRRDLAGAFGGAGRVITDVVPEVELIIGPQPAVPELNPEESRNRFNMMFTRFVSFIATPDRPLVIFLDNLQWADAASLGLVKTLASGHDIRGLLIVAAYRDIEARDSSLLLTVLEETRMAGVPITGIELGPLDEQRVNLLLSRFLRRTEDATRELARVVHRKTGGNPFFIIQFLKTLYEERLMLLDTVTGWDWDLRGIKGLQVTDNVIAFMADKIGRMPGGTRSILEACACIGTEFDLDTLTRILGLSYEEILTELSAELYEGLIVTDGAIYRFYHDRIHEAVNALIPEERKVSYHARLGLLLLEECAEPETAPNLFVIVNHLNYGASMVAEREKRIWLARLNHAAGRRARNSQAYASAAQFFAAGTSLMPENGWETDYDLTFRLHRDRMESEYLVGNFNMARELFGLIRSRAASAEDLADAHMILVNIHTSMNRPEEAVRLGLEGIAAMGVRLPARPSKALLALEILRIRVHLAGKEIPSLVDRPICSDRRVVSLIRLMSTTATPAFYTNPDLAAYIILRSVRLNLVHGLTEDAALGYIALASVAGAYMGDFDACYQFGLLALAVNAKLDDRVNRGQVEFGYAWFSQHPREHLRNCIPFYRAAYEHCLEGGNMIYAGHSINILHMYRILTGESIDLVEEEYRRHRDLLKTIRDPFVYNNYLDNIQLIMNLTGRTPDPASFNSPGYEEERQLAMIRADRNKLYLFNFLTYKVLSLFLHERYADAVTYIEMMQPVRDIPRGAFHRCDYVLFEALACAARASQVTGRRRRRLVRLLRKDAALLRKWKDICPVNHAHKSLLADAELCRVTGRGPKAMELYHCAIESARENGFVHLEAVASELAGNFHLARGYPEIAGLYLSEARMLYVRWGAAVKVGLIDARHGGLLTPLPEPRDAGLRAVATASVIDLKTLQKSLKIIAEEKILSAMLEKTLLTALEFAGAQRAMLLLAADGDALRIEAEGSSDGGAVSVLRSVPYETSGSLSVACVNYVRRTRQRVVIRDAREPQDDIPGLDDEPYIRAGQVKSILCAPVIRGRGMIGIFYLENNLAAGAFSPDRIEMLELLSLQAAANLELAQEASMDGLTGLFNHKYFQNMLLQELQLSRRHGRRLSLIMIDLDLFKTINDRWGHQTGDRVLRETADAIRGSCRATDIVARYGGEEMAIIMPETTPEAAAARAEVIRTAIERMAILHDDTPIRVTCSAGVAGYPAHSFDRASLIARADEALYRAKRGGRNRVVLAE